MSERITGKDIERICGTINEALASKDSSRTYGLSLFAQRRNGYTAIDLFDGDVLKDTIKTGTTSEIYTYLQGMRRMQMLGKVGCRVIVTGVIAIRESVGFLCLGFFAGVVFAAWRQVKLEERWWPGEGGSEQEAA